MGTKGITLKNIADACGVSPSAVSRILQYDDKRYNEATRQMVRDTARRMKYRPNLLAQAVRTGKTGVVGILMRRHGDEADFPPGLVAGINTTFLGAGYQVLIAGVTQREIDRRELPAMITSGLAEGVLTYGFITEPDYLELLKEAAPLLVTLEDRCPAGGYCVIFDEYQAGVVAAEHFFTCGYRQVAIIDTSDDVERHRLRVAGFCDRFRDLWQQKLDIPIFQDYAWSNKAGAAAARQIVALPKRPEAVMAINDYFAIHAMMEFQLAGLRVPDDIAIAGIGGEQLFVYPTLSRAHLPKARLGLQAVQKVLNLLNGKETEEVTKLPIAFEPGLSTRLNASRPAGCFGRKRAEFQEPA